jgi:hypothetical protein
MNYNSQQEQHIHMSQGSSHRVTRWGYMEEIFQFHLDIPYSFLHKNEGPPCFLGLEKDTEVGNAIRLTEKCEC